MVADWSGLVNEAWIVAIMKVDCRRVLPVLAKNLQVVDVILKEGKCK